MKAGQFGNNEALSRLPEGLRTTMNFERGNLYLPEKYRDSRLTETFDTRYLPENCAAFELPCFWIRRSEFYVYGGLSLASGGLDFVGGNDPQRQALFPVHPAECDHYCQFLAKMDAQNAAESGLRVWAVPTSSTRTVLAWPEHAPDEAIFVKLSLHSRLFGDRRITRRTAAVSVGLSMLLENSRPTLPDQLGYLFEHVSFVPRGMTDSGVVVRAIPDEVRCGDVVLAPFFALMGGDGSGKPLMLTIAENGRIGVMEFVEEVLCKQFAKLWVEMATTHGLLLEAHGQDLLLGLSNVCTATGKFYYRDFEGLTVDWELRRARNLTQPANLPNSCLWYETYGTWGYPHFQSVWCKVRTSLFDYIHLFLVPLEGKLRDWHAGGLLNGEVIAHGAVTMMFSRHLRREIEERFSVREGADYDISPALNRFVKFLMKVRKIVLEGISSAR